MGCHISAQIELITQQPSVLQVKPGFNQFLLNLHIVQLRQHLLSNRKPGWLVDLLARSIDQFQYFIAKLHPLIVVQNVSIKLLQLRTGQNPQLAAPASHHHVAQRK